MNYRKLFAAAVVSATFLASGCVRVVSMHSGSHSKHLSEDGIYEHDVAVKGKDYGLIAPDGFSYEIEYDSLDAAANGSSDHYNEVENMSKNEVDLLQQKYADDIVDGLNKCVGKEPPQWVQGKAAVVVKPNYYPGGTPDPINLTLQKNEFPVNASSNDGKKLRDEILKAIKDHWGDITD